MKYLKYILISSIILLAVVGVLVFLTRERKSDEYVSSEPAKFIMSIYLPGCYMIEIKDEKEIEDIVRIFEEHDMYEKREPLKEGELPYGGLDMVFKYNNGEEEHINIINGWLLISKDEVYTVGDELDDKLDEYIKGTMEYKRKQEEDKKKEEEGYWEHIIFPA